MSDRVSVAIVGAAGRMGNSLLEVAADRDDLRVVAGLVVAGSDDEGRELGPQAIEGTSDYAAAAEAADVFVDFSVPAGCLEAAEAAAIAGTAFVSGTTGLSDEQKAALADLTSDIPTLHASNFSVGVNLLEELVAMTSEATDGAFDIEVFEAHHRNKVDAPSGTALTLGEAAAQARGHELDEVAVWGREGEVGARTDDEIGFQVVRGGDIVGEHTVMFCGAGERIELTHRAQDRNIFAQGALRAAVWVCGREAGEYSMQDVLFG